jgi:trimeric autotransporter adhesin
MAIIDGTADSDVLRGTNDDDTINGFESDDFIKARDGNDMLFGGSGNDELVGGEGDDLVNGDDGIDRASFYDYGHTVFIGCTVSLLLMGVPQDTGHGMDKLIGIEHLSGTQFSDVLTGDDGDNWLWGQSLDFDLVTRTENADTLYGGGGNDLLTVGGGDNILKGGDGTDTVALFDTNGAVTVSLELQGAVQDTGQGMMLLKGIEGLSGSDFSDTLIGNNQANQLLGASGDDTLSGGKGADQLYGDGLMAIDGVGYSGAITIFPSGETGAGDHDGNIAEGSDTLAGGRGDDKLIGAGGPDKLTGGPGNDSFIYLLPSDSKPGGGEDTITDLHNTDYINLSALDADTSTPGDDAFTLVPVLTGAAGEVALRYDTTLHMTVLELENNGDGIVDMRVFITGHHTDFTNFLL